MTTTLTARSPEDVLAMVPVVLGFVPTDSIVMLTFGASRPFHARVDLPPPEGSAAEVVASLRDPAVRHGVDRVLFVLYSEDAHPAARVSSRLVRDFRAAGIDVIDVLRADGRRWFPVLHRRRSRAAGVPYDVSAHRFAAQAVLDGRVLHRSRTDLVASIETDPARAALVGRAHDGDASDPLWVQETVERHAECGTVPSDAEAARLLRAVGTHTASRDAAWVGLRRADATQHVALWTDLLRRAPDELVPGAASLLGLLAWLAGNGALAWCAVDRAVALEPDHSLARLVGDLLTAAVPPTDWERLWGAPDPA